MISRRALIAALGALVAPLIAEAQQRERVYRIAIVFPASKTVADMIEEPIYKVFLSELGRLGYVEGLNLVVDRLVGEGRTERYAGLASEVVRLQPDLILAVGGPMALRFKAATTTIPIVALTGDPIADGLVTNLARPGGNITGFSVNAGEEIYGKQLELLREVAAEVSRVVFLLPRRPWEARYGRVVREAAQRGGLTLVGAPLGDPIQEPEYRRAFAAMAGERAQALIVSDHPENWVHRRLVVELAERARLPAVYAFREFVEMGGLMSYGTNVPNLFRRAAVYVDKILKGAKPADLPIEQPTKFELVINLKTAKALGLTIPPSVLRRADEIIQ
jgi:ABC-type uncharacterized transport system substrate-binding protein